MAPGRASPAFPSSLNALVELTETLPDREDPLLAARPYPAQVSRMKSLVASSRPRPTAMKASTARGIGDGKLAGVAISRGPSAATGFVVLGPPSPPA